ncbi:hypothetical protein C8R21_1294 [Nitrosospira multiformis]|uniref:Uncharacterized protein n=1 Tax=Nitrosospira multiformis TaxID=1231 RepID=A0A2T5I699_9PROT|nr:hypothetical protein C8R21_1294 [Nitrosospira multiformis]
MYSLRYPLRRLSLPERIPGGIEVWLLEFDVGLSVPRDDEAYESAHDFPPPPGTDGYAAALAFQTHDRASTQGKSREVSRQTSRLPLSRLDPCQGRAAYPQVCDQSIRQIDHS